MATLDELQAQLAALTQRVNEITAPPDDYYTHRFSGEEIDNAVGRVAATAGSGAITAGDIGAAPSGWGFGDNSLGFYNDSGDETPGLDYLTSIYNGMLDGTFKCFSFTDFYTLTAMDTTRVVHCKLYRFSSQNALAEFRTTVAAGYVIIAYRAYSNGWKPMELLNPQMLSGVEYRTIERHNGKPVYAKLVAPVHAICVPETKMDMVLGFGIKNPESILECICLTGKYENGNIINPIDIVTFQNSDDLYIRRTGMDPSYVRLGFKGFDGDYGFMAKIKYTKTTD